MATRKRTKLAQLPSPTVADTAPEDVESKDILARIAALRERYQDRYDKDTEYENLFWMKRDDKDREGEETIISSKPFDVVNLATDMLSTFAPLIDIPPLSSKESDRLDAEQKEKWLEAAFYVLQARSTFPIIPQMARDANLYGRFCVQAVYVEDTDDDLPIRVKVLNPKEVYPDFDADGRLWGLAIIKQLRAGEIKRSFPDIDLTEIVTKRSGATELRPIADEELVEWREWWDGVRWVFFANSKEVDRQEHGYGRLPFIFRYGRYARADNKSNEAISLLKGMEGTAYAYDRMLSTEATAAINNVFSAWVANTENAENAKIKLEPGYINYLRPGESLSPVQRQGPLPDLQSVIAKLKDEIEGTSFRALAGQMDNASSGFALEQLTRGERMKLSPVKQNLDLGLSDLCKLMFQIVARSGQEVTLAVPRVPGLTDNYFYGQVTLAPADAKKYKQVFVNVPPDLLQDLQRQASLALQLTSGDAPLLDKDTARRRFMHITDTEHVEARLAEESLFKATLPLFVQYIMQRTGITPPQGQPGQPPQQGGLPQNGGAPATTPQAQGIGPETMTDSEAGVPPTGAGNPDTAGVDAVNAMLGQGGTGGMGGMMGLMAARGTPQATGKGR